MKADGVRGTVAVTDTRWFEFLRGRPALDEVNFWRPTATRVNDLPGTPWYFKAKAPINKIVGGGFFAHYTSMPVAMAWECFGEKNGAPDYQAFAWSLSRLRNDSTAAYPPSTFGSTVIGCVVLSSPFFFRDDEFVPVPSDFQPSTQVRKTYDLGGGEGLLLWKRVQERLRVPSATGVSPLAAAGLAYGDPRLVRPRLGQGGFRTVVLDAYGRRCTVTGERTLPALEAAHIQPYAVVQQHEVTNGLALRSDIHRLFDQGYVTVDPSLHFRVSRAIREEFENGRDYYALHGQEIRLPAESDNRPHLTALDWHLSTVYLGD